MNSERLYSRVLNRFVHFPPQCVNLEKNSLPTCCGQIIIFLHQIMFIPVLLRIIKRCWATEEGNWRERKKHSPCRVACGSKVDKIYWKFPGAFSCYLLMSIMLSMLDPFAVSWTRLKIHSWNLLGFIGQVMISGIQFDNHAQEELPTLEIEYSTLSEEIKGL